MNAKLDKYEKDILESFTNNEWRKVENMEAEIERHKMYAHETFKKEKRVNIRLSQRDINLLKIKAMEEGLPYQTLMASVLHKYAANKSF